MTGGRMIIISIDDICRLFADYAGLVSYPEDGKPIQLKLNPQEQKLGIIVESDSFKGDEGIEELRFDIQRVYGVS
jgi:hypothetical protein